MARETGDTNGQGARCRTKYPLILVHGVGSRDDWRVSYWGRVPEQLRAQGAKVYLGGQEAWGVLPRNAALLCRTIRRVLAQTGAQKVNIIAHSKGGLEARMAISQLGMAPYVASLTTISTPHRGSRAIDIFYKVPKALYQLAGLVVDGVFLVMGDSSPDFYRASRELSTYECARFNRENPEMPGVFYQSYAAVMAGGLSDPMFALTNPVISLLEGENDGLVSVRSARWKNFRGTIASSGYRGVSHMDIVDRRRKERGFDSLEFYLNLVQELRDRGF